MFVAVIHPAMSKNHMMPSLHVSVYSLLCHLNHVLCLVSDDDRSDVEQWEAGNLDKREVLMIISCSMHASFSVLDGPVSFNISRFYY